MVNILIFPFGMFYVLPPFPAIIFKIKKKKKERKSTKNEQAPPCHQVQFCIQGIAGFEWKSFRFREPK